MSYGSMHLRIILLFLLLSLNSTKNQDNTIAKVYNFTTIIKMSDIQFWKILIVW